MKQIEIPQENWQEHLAEAVKSADDETVIFVDTEDKKQQALITAERMGKSVTVAVGKLVNREKFSTRIERADDQKLKEALEDPGARTYIGGRKIPDGARVVAHTLCEIDPETGEHIVHEILAYLVYDEDGNLTMEIAELQSEAGDSDDEKSQEDRCRIEAGLVSSSTESAYVMEKMKAKCPKCNLNLDKMTNKGKVHHAPEFAICFVCGFVFELHSGPVKRVSDLQE